MLLRLQVQGPGQGDPRLPTLEYTDRQSPSGSRYRARVRAIPASRHWNTQTDSHPPAPGTGPGSARSPPPDTGIHRQTVSHPPAPGTGPGSARSPPPDTEIHRQTVTLRLQVQGPGQGDPRLPTLEYTDRQTDRQSTSGSRYRARVSAIPASRHWNTQTDSHPPAPGTGPGSGRSPPPDTGIHRQTVTLRLQVQGPGQGDPRLPTLEYTDRQTDRQSTSGSRYRARVRAIPASLTLEYTDSHPPAPGTGPGSARSPPPDTGIHRQTVTLRLQVQGPGQGDPRLPTLEYTDRQSPSGSRYRARVRAIPASRHWNTQTDRQTDSQPPAPGTGPGSGRSPPPDTGIHRQSPSGSRYRARVRAIPASRHWNTQTDRRILKRSYARRCSH